MIYRTIIVVICAFLFSCYTQEIKSKQIVDTLKYGDYYKELGVNDRFEFNIKDAKADTLLTLFENKHDYLVKFEMPRFKKYPIKVNLLKNGELISTGEKDVFLMQVNTLNSNNYLDFEFEVDLQGDSILIHHRNWTDSLKVEYEDKYVGFEGKGYYRISVKPEESSI